MTDRYFELCKEDSVNGFLKSITDYLIQHVAIALHRKQPQVQMHAHYH